MIKDKIAELIHPFGSSGGDSPSTETILWENDTPEIDFSSRTIYLSKSAISNYKYLKFIFANTKTRLNNLITVLYQPQDMEPLSKLYSDWYGEPCVTTRESYDNELITYTRKFWYAEDSESEDPSRKYYVFFYDSLRATGTGMGFQNNSILIPLKIIGIK